jgi:signal transduction histidine kinase
LPGVVTCNVSDCRFYAAVHRHAEGAFESTFHRPDGTSFPAEICSSSMARPDGMQVGSVITFRDATQKRLALAAAETERRYREAEAQNRAKDNFLATLSHELRTPMTSILGWVQFLARGSTPEELAEARQSIESSARLQARLIDDMLDVSRIILGKFDVDLRPTRITDVVEAAVVMARPAASDRELQLVTEIDDRDAVVDADPPRLRQVIDNLLSNAIKFSSPGNSVELRIERPNGSVKISVTDHGAGIDPTFLPYVFDRLSQAEDAGNRSGLGLGLAIARHVVALHGGELTAYSEGLERGARFTVTLPVLRVPLPASERVDSSGTMISA